MTGPHTAPTPSPEDELRILSDHRPGLEAGDYTVHAHQDVSVAGDAADAFLGVAHVAVAGPRFELPPDLVAGVFPPRGSRGDHRHVLPHLTLGRSTLPWERSACDEFPDKNERPPWLALLLFDPDELAGVQREVVTLDSLTSPTSDPAWPGATPESGQHSDDRVVVIDVPWTTLRGLLPAGPAELRLRSHSRRVTRPRTRVRVRHHGSFDGLVHDLDRQTADGVLGMALQAEGITIGPHATWRDDLDGGPWHVTDPVGGTFEIEVGRDRTGVDHVRVVGGPVPSTGPADVAAQHDLVLGAFPVRAWADELDGDHLAHGLRALLDAIHVSVGAPAVTGQERGRSWRLTDDGEDVHHVVHLEDDEVLDVRGFADADEEVAVVLGNRLPKPGARSVAHLVSIEDRFVLEGGCVFPVPPDGGAVRLVSLASWDFFCLDPAHSFVGLLEGLNRTSEDESVPPQFGIATRQDVVRLQEAAQGRRDSELPAERLVLDRLLSGAVPLRHRLRRGARTVSWYRGPLLATLEGRDWASQVLDLLPVRHADELLLLDDDTGMLDVSYAAAWELGRMLTLANAPVARSMYAWKRAHVHEQARTRHLAALGFDLPLAHPGRTQTGTVAPPALPADLARWFAELSVLRHVPFSYLVSDPRLLPPESLRFFTLDPVWMACLRDGAFSIGRVHEHRRRQDAELIHEHVGAPELRRRAGGVLLRSEVIASYPGLQLDGYAAHDPAIAGLVMDLDPSNPLRQGHLDPAMSNPLGVLRRDDLSPDVTLVIFDDEPTMLDAHRRPETLHFGLDDPDPVGVPPEQRRELRRLVDAGGDLTLTKSLRPRDWFDPSSRVTRSRHAEQSGERPVIRRDRFGDGPEFGLRVDERRIVDLEQLALVMSALTDLRNDPATFALQMIAGTDLVRFMRNIGEMR